MSTNNQLERKQLSYEMKKIKMPERLKEQTLQYCLEHKESSKTGGRLKMLSPYLISALGVFLMIGLWNQKQQHLLPYGASAIDQPQVIEYSLGEGNSRMVPTFESFHFREKQGKVVIAPMSISGESVVSVVIDTKFYGKETAVTQMSVSEGEVKHTPILHSEDEGVVLHENIVWTITAKELVEEKPHVISIQSSWAPGETYRFQLVKTKFGYEFTNIN